MDSLEPVTLGEVNRRVTELRGDMQKGFDLLQRRLDSLQFVSQDVYRSEMAVVLREIGDLKDDRKVERRMLATAILTGLVFPLLVGLIILAAR